VRGNSDDETPVVTTQSVNKHSVKLVNILDSRGSFLLNYAPISGHIRQHMTIFLRQQVFTPGRQRFLDDLKWYDYQGFMPEETEVCYVRRICV
jgi:hypothetical protein